MDIHFYPDRKTGAWPDGCPCCGEVTRQFDEQADTGDGWWQIWEFKCGGVVQYSVNGLSPDYDCPEAMWRHLEGIVVHDLGDSDLTAKAGA